MSCNPEYADLEIRIGELRDKGYPVDTTLNGEQDFPRGYLGADVLPWVASGDLVADGQQLFDMLLADDHLQTAWAEARGQARWRRIRLRIDPVAAELHALPWELLQEDGVMLSAQAVTPFSRYLPIALPWGGPVRERPIRVLVAISNPDDLAKYNLAQVNVELERDTLTVALGEIDRGEVEVCFLDPPVTLERLEQALRDSAGGALGYHVLHYVGHGYFDQPLGQASLYLEDDGGSTHPVFDDALVGMLRRLRVRPHLVFLAACESATRSTTDAFAGLGPKLVSAGVPAVVAMQASVSMETARKFSEVFYTWLVKPGPVDLAANYARSTLLTAGRPDAAVPVLFMRLRSGQLWGGEPEEEREPDRRYTPPPPPDPDDLPEPGSLPTGSRLPFHPNALFTGRKESLKALAHALLHGGANSTLVQGMGGMGKTQLAVEFAYCYGRFFQGVHWLNCAQPELIGAEVAACGEEIGLTPWPEEQPEQVRTTLRTWHGGGPRLVVLDNLEEVEAAREWLHRLSGDGVRLLVTARRGDWPGDLGMELLRLDVFTEGESLDFLRRYLPGDRATNAELAALAERLGHLPLALELAGRWLKRHPRLSLTDYVAEMGDVLAHPAMQKWRVDLGSPTGHDLDLAATFGVSWAWVEDEGARHLFQVAAYCAPNQPIPYELLERSLKAEPSRRFWRRLARVFKRSPRPVDLDEALAELTGPGLLALEDPAAGPSIHPLLCEYGRALPAEGALAPLPALAGALAGLAGEALESGLPARFVSLRPHLEMAAPAVEKAGLKEAGRLWMSLGRHLEDVAEYAGARAAYERALTIWRETYGEENPLVATAHNNLGIVLLALGDLEGARVEYERALTIWRETAGEEDPLVATALSGLGGVLQDQGDLAGARTAYERALAISEAAYGPDDEKVTTHVNNLAAVLHRMGDLERARAEYERALTILRQTYGEEHPTFALALNNLGSVLRDLGDEVEARAAFERALAIREKVLGREHPGTAQSLWWLGRLEHDAGNVQAARTYLEEALAISERFLPPEHSHIALLREHLERLA